jgi:beta-N-acetylglucosaminidase
MFENLSSSEWLLYISEWQYCNTTISNIRCTTKVAVNSLLSDNAVLQERGSAIVHNLACKEVKTVVCIPHTQMHTCACTLLSQSHCTGNI